MLSWGANIAKSNVIRYERKLDREELRYIMQSINFLSRQGYTGLKWRGELRKNTIRILKDEGYKIYPISYCIYEIEW